MTEQRLTDEQIMAAYDAALAGGGSADSCIIRTVRAILSADRGAVQVPRKVDHGHGHVWPRADGAKARCGGPAICKLCALDHAAKTAAAQESKE